MIHTYVMIVQQKDYLLEKTLIETIRHYLKKLDTKGRFPKSRWKKY